MELKIVYGPQSEGNHNQPKGPNWDAKNVLVEKISPPITYGGIEVGRAKVLECAQGNFGQESSGIRQYFYQTLYGQGEKLIRSSDSFSPYNFVASAAAGCLKPNPSKSTTDRSWGFRLLFEAEEPFLGVHHSNYVSANQYTRNEKDAKIRTEYSCE
jgi:hypothetical protein